MIRKFGLVSVLSLMLVAGLVGLAPAQQGPQTTAPTKQAPKGPPQGSGFPDLVKGLKETPGCLGVETAKISSGKSVIFAWFQDKTAAVAWYKSPMHRGVMKMMGDDATATKNPLKNVKDDGRPVLIIASITFTDKPMIEGIPMPISQIAIETYQPVDSGFAIGGHFAPEGMKFPEANEKEKVPAKK